MGFIHGSPSWSQLLLSQPHASLLYWLLHTHTPTCVHHPNWWSLDGPSDSPDTSQQEGSLWMNFVPAWLQRVVSVRLPRPAVPDLSFYLKLNWCVFCAAVRPVRLSVCLHFIQALVWSHSNQEDPASLCWAGRRRSAQCGRRRLMWIFGGGVRVTACMELMVQTQTHARTHTHPGVCRDAKNLSRNKTDRLLHTFFFFSPNKATQTVPVIKPGKLHRYWKWIEIFLKTNVEFDPLFLNVILKNSLEISEQCMESWSKQGKQWPDNGQTGNSFCLLSCFSTFNGLLMSSR